MIPFTPLFYSIVDLRWGIREHATDDHRTTDICLSEIDKCISSTIFGAPCFIYLGFDRYGAPSLPRLVPKAEMEHLISTIKVCHEREMNRPAILLQTQGSKDYTQ